MRSQIKCLLRSLLLHSPLAILLAVSLLWAGATCWAEYLMARGLARQLPTNEHRLEAVQDSVNDLAHAALMAPWDKRFRLAMVGYLFDLVTTGIAADAAQAALMSVQLAVRSDPLDGKLYAMAAVLYWRLGQCPEGDDAIVKYKEWGKPSRTQVDSLERARLVCR